MPAVRRAHVPRQRQDAEAGALADVRRAGAAARGRPRGARAGRARRGAARAGSTGDPAARRGASQAVRGAVRRGARAGSWREGASAGRSDELVAHLLLVHDLHPVDVETRVAQALEEVRPYLGSHGGDVELLGVEDGVARLRLGGTLRRLPVLDRDAASTRSRRRSRGRRRNWTRVEAEGVAEPAQQPLAPARLARLPAGARRSDDAAPARLAAAARPAEPSRHAPRSAASCAASRSPPEHRHLLDLQRAALLCACRAVLDPVRPPRRGRRPLRLVPERAGGCSTTSSSTTRCGRARHPGRPGVLLPEHAPPVAWSRSTRARSAPTESLLELTAWDELARRTRCSRELQPDVEALLVNRTGERARALARPVDRCYELVGAHPHALEGLRRRPGGVAARSPRSSTRLRRDAVTVTTDEEEADVARSRSASPT